MKKGEFSEIIKECVKEVLIQEGFFDRIKSRYSGAKSGAGHAIKGGLDALDAKVFGLHHDKYNAAKNLTLGKNKYESQKIEKYKEIASAKLDGVASEIMNDLEKLGINTKGVSQKQINFFKRSLMGALQDLIDRIPTGPQK